MGFSQKMFLPLAARRQNHGLMQGVGRRDDHRIDVRVVERVFETGGKRQAAPGTECRRRVLVDIDPRTTLIFSEPSSDLTMVVPHHPKPMTATLSMYISLI